jgi:hypothetical protein
MMFVRLHHELLPGPVGLAFADLQGVLLGQVRVSALLRRAADARSGRSAVLGPTLQAGARALSMTTCAGLYRIYNSRKGAAQWTRDAATVLARRAV